MLEEVLAVVVADAAEEEDLVVADHQDVVEATLEAGLETIVKITTPQW